MHAHSSSSNRLEAKLNLTYISIGALQVLNSYTFFSLQLYLSCTLHISETVEYIWTKLKSDATIIVHYTWNYNSFYFPYFIPMERKMCQQKIKVNSIVTVSVAVD